MYDPGEPPQDLTCDQLNRGMRIYQRAKGHRAAMDDTLLAWCAQKFAPSDTRRSLDLGTGKGTVALLLLHVCPRLSTVGIEAYTESVQLARMNIELNALQGRFEVFHGDLRERAKWSELGQFDLITGAPPFMPLGTGIQPTDPQRTVGRFEIRGGVEDYYETAQEKLTSRGRVVVLMNGHGKERNLEACRRAGLHPIQTVDVLPRPFEPATYSLCIAQRHPAPFRKREIAVRRHGSNDWSLDYLEIRRALDLP